MADTPGTFAAIGPYYDLLYRDKDYQQETRYLLDLLQRLRFGGRSVLEFGSGTGQHGRLLAAAGLDVLGVEMSPSMLARSHNAPGFAAVLGDARSHDAGRRFDLVLALFHVASYQTEEADIDALFANAACHLQPGGLFVFDCWFSPAVHQQQPGVRVKRMADAHTEVTRIAEPVNHAATNRVDVHYTMFVRDLGSGQIRQFSELHPMRHFSLPELDRIAARCGLQRQLAEGFLSGAAPDASTWGVCLAYRRPDHG